MPRVSSADAAAQAAQDLIHALEKPSTTAPYNTIGTGHTVELRRLAEIFCIVQPRPISATTPKVVKYEAPPRANNDNIAPLRVKTAIAPSVVSPMNQEPPFNVRPQQTPTQHRYPTRNKTRAHNFTIITPDNSQLYISKVPGEIITTRDYHHIFHNQKTDLVDIIPRANRIIC